MSTYHATAIFGSGCFWCTEAVFSELKGVLSVMPGYTGGTLANPTYEQICSGNTGHAEVLQVVYDPRQITFRDLLTVFFGTHDPTTVNRQGSDVGTQYHSIILTTSAEQQAEAESFIKELAQKKLFGSPIVTTVEPRTAFYPAEEYHKDYCKKNPDRAYGQTVIYPKLQKFRERYRGLIRRPS